MLIPVCMAYRTEYSNDVMSLCGSQMNGYSVRAIPSVEAAMPQASCTSRAISQSMKLLGRRSIRAAISPGTTIVAPPPAAPEMSCAITFCSPCCHPVSGDDERKAGVDWALYR